MLHFFLKLICFMDHSEGPEAHLTHLGNYSQEQKEAWQLREGAGVQRGGGQMEKECCCKEAEAHLLILRMPCRRVLTLSYRKLILVSDLHFIWIHLVTLRQSMQLECSRDFIEEVGLALGKSEHMYPSRMGGLRGQVL